MRAKQWLANRKLFVRRLYKNVKVLIRPGEEISECVYVEGYYEPNQMYFLDHQLKPGAVFIDAGANDGLYTLFAAHKVGPQGLVISIEPSTREYEHLCKNIRLNDFKNIRTLRAAVSNVSGFAELKVAESSKSGHNTLSQSFYYKDTTLEAVEKINTTTIDEVTEADSISRVDILKLDIEGWELSALEGATRTLVKFRPLLMIEIICENGSAFGSNSGKIWEFLTNYGYQMKTYSSVNGLPVEATEHPGPGYTDFIAVPKKSV